ncbi:MAG: acyltransferase [Myxococcota bacterium]|jgi:peptidoglycan/LPS O-acetylase OafA/YrhL|nr:acyltransferase [Myxococcota bacterium]
MSESTQRERIAALDSLRGMAAFGVTLFWHYSHFGAGRVFEGMAADWLYRYGLMLVDFFFVLSGFVLSHVYLEALKRREVHPATFFVLRFSRLYPLHLVTLLYVAGLQGWRFREGLDSFVYQANDLAHFVLNLLFLQQGVVRTVYSYNGPAWSLTIEEVSYLAFFVSLYFFAKSFRAVFAGLVVLGAAINLTNLDTHLLNLDISRGLVGFFAGALAFQLHRVAQERERSTQLAVLAAIICVVVVGYYTKQGYPRTSSILVVHSLLIFPAAVLLVLNSGPLNRLVSVGPLAYLGEISYSVYMLHFPVQLTLVTLDQRLGLGFAYFSLDFFVLYAASVVAVSVGSFHAFERPVQQWIRSRLIRAR